MGRRKRTSLDVPYELCFTPERKAYGDGLRRVAACLHEGTSAAARQTRQEEILRRVLWE